MTSFTEEIRNRQFVSGEPLISEALIVAQKVFFNYGMAGIPASYADFLKQYNGIKSGGAYLFGATVDDDLDIIDKNLQMSKPENTLLLGYNDFDLLVFDYTTKSYQIVDRLDFAVLENYTEDEIDFALRQIFNVG